jgi:cell wall-associated NlpC family hydrolase
VSDNSIERGRHRSAARHNPLAELAAVAVRAGDGSIKATAVLAASGGLVAAFALPASASPAPAAAPAAPVAPVAAAPAKAAAPALVAPKLAVPASPVTFGIDGITVVAKPKPKPVVVTPPADANRSSSNGTASRASNRSSLSQGASNASQSGSQQSNSSSPSNSSKSSAPQQRPAPVQSVGGVVSIARGLLGIPYVFGGSTPAGFDCSGFTQYVFGRAGISIPRTASAQQAAATPVSNPQPGDLVFFGYPAFHVGIYTGPGMMIDSPRTGKSTAERSIWSSNVSYGRF